MPVNAIIDARRLKSFCRRHHIRKLSIFGSALRTDFGSESDVDVLVDFTPGKTPGLAIVTIEEELSRLFGRKMDLLTFGSLNQRIRDRVLAEAQVQYEER